MRLRKSRVGTKVVALLLSLAALWVFAAWVTLREGVNLLWVSTLDTGVSEPTEALVSETQKERRASLVFLGDHRQRQALLSQRKRTDAALANFKERTEAGDVQLAASPEVERHLADVKRMLGTLGNTRKSIDEQRISRDTAANSYTELADSMIYTYDILTTLDDQEFAQDARALVEMYRAKEVFAQEDAILAGTLARGRFEATQYERFVQFVGVRRYLHDKAVTALGGVDAGAYDRLIKSGAQERVRNLEDLVIRINKADTRPALPANQWRFVTETALREMDQAVTAAGDRLVDRAAPIATAVIVRLVLAGGLGLLAVIASVVLSITTARDLVRQLDRLRTAAGELAHERLPRVVARLGRGEKVDVAAEAPPLRFGDDQIGQVGQAFNDVQETAIRVAVEQAELRRSIREILLSLARRTQSLVHRQLALLDTMERRESDPGDLKDLFRVDHLATRMRRNAENLIVLSGASPARSWRRPVPMIDVVRGALAEVEDYTRVTVPPMGEVSLVGRAVGDVIHLLAELIENAVSYSPPYTIAEVHGQIVANGYVIEIEDRGLGMSAADLQAANDRIDNPPEFDLRDTSRLGLFVVSRLAERHGIKVSLKGSPYGGTTAVILLPPDIVLAEEGGASRRGAGSGPAITLTAEGVTGPGGGDPAIARRTAVLGETSSMSEPSAKPALTATTGGEAHTDPGRNGLPVLPALPRRHDLPADLPGDDDEDLGDRADRGGFGGGDRSFGGETHPRHDDETPGGESDQPSFTPGGLPFRVPQASLAPALRAEPAPPEPVSEADEDERDPEEIRRIMGSYQSGTMRGRMAAEQARVEDYGHAPRHSADRRPGWDRPDSP
ncbi:sensor histidine kinase [Spongiactinospora sp. TRM90649]|uniref:sensor histidine kinase n=1 Tax=Spongiactinospora sp. TRM90649 TaxID=3031114 RepID=UPI0023F95BF5|nr:sensor histidine kinase [Spongiactinospora sp. TRM90649]MDF5752030.1 sensor histidine kinase [Spongiactinospora sp. TRM90649]